MPLADTSVHIPVLPAAAAWNVALQRMFRAETQLQGHQPPGLLAPPADARELAAISGFVRSNVIGAPALDPSRAVPTVFTSGAADDMLMAVRTLQAADFGGAGAGLQAPVQGVVNLLASSSAALSTAPTPARIAVAQAQLQQAAALAPA